MKLINLVFMILSLVVIIAMVATIGNLLDAVGMFMDFGFDLDDLQYLLENSTTEEIMAMIATLGSVLFILFGFPVTIFLVSMNGLKN
jgi:hypothetical protein